MSVFLSLCVLALSSPGVTPAAQVPAKVPLEIVGTVELGKMGPTTVVYLRPSEEPTPTLPRYILGGAHLPALKQMQSATLRIRGHAEAMNITVDGFEILLVYGKQPIVGTIVHIAGKIALTDGDGSPILLNLAPRSYRRMLGAQGARAWVIGTLLLTGELKVERYAILAPSVVASAGD